MMSPAVLFLLKIALDIHGIVCFDVNLIFFEFCVDVIGNFMDTALNIQITFVTLSQY